MPLSAAQIKAALKAEGPKPITQGQIARVLGYSVQAVSDVVRGVSRSPRIEAAIARAIGREVDEVFPVVPVEVPPPNGRVARRRVAKEERAA